MPLANLGKAVALMGLLLLMLGGLFVLLDKFGPHRLPGDLVFGGKNWKIYLPLASSLIASLVVTLLLNLLARLFR